MANDIALIKQNIAINDKRAVCSTMPTGETAKRLVRSNYPVNLTINNIESKFDNRFDDPSYYYGIGNSTVIGG
jgi:hypothetical protein